MTGELLCIFKFEKNNFEWQCERERMCADPSRGFILSGHMDLMTSLAGPQIVRGIDVHVIRHDELYTY